MSVTVCKGVGSGGKGHEVECRSGLGGGGRANAYKIVKFHCFVCHAFYGSLFECLSRF